MHEIPIGDMLPFEGIIAAANRALATRVNLPHEVDLVEGHDTYLDDALA